MTSANAILLTEKEVTAALKIHRSTLWRLMSANLLPKPKKIGIKSNRWLESDIQAYINAQ